MKIRIITLIRQLRIQYWRNGANELGIFEVLTTPFNFHSQCRKDLVQARFIHWAPLLTAK
jgi:hypothetical protein